MRVRMTTYLKKITEDCTGKIVDLTGFGKLHTNDVLPDIREVVEKAYKAGQDFAADHIYEELNRYVGALDNPDYELPSGAEMIEIIDSARSLKDPQG